MAGTYEYQPGFNNEFSSSALPGALPPYGNSPQKCPYDLFAEPVSGTAFTAPRKENKRTWMYRVQPSVLHKPFERVPDSGKDNGKDNGKDGDYAGYAGHGPFTEANGFEINPNQLRWNPLPLPPSGSSRTFVESLFTKAGHGDPTAKEGLAIHMYSANESMGKSAMQNADGDFLIVPQVGTLTVRTELGFLEVPPRQICVIPRGIVFSVAVSGPSRGYVLEVFKGHFDLPDLGPIGSNGLANPRDFEHPVASFDASPSEPWTLLNKFGGRMFSTTREGTPFNVVAWHGNYAPFR